MAEVISTIDENGVRQEVSNNNPILTKKAATRIATTTTPLGANASYVSGTIDMGVGAPRQGLLRVVARADQAGTLYLQQSTDGTNWFTTKPSDAGIGTALSGNGVPVAATPGDGIVAEFKLAARYARIKYDNAGTAQGVFSLTGVAFAQ